MYGLALCLPRVGQPQGLPVPREIPKNRTFLGRGFRGLRPENHAARIPLPPGRGLGDGSSASTYPCCCPEQMSLYDRGKYRYNSCKYGHSDSIGTKFKRL